jgi:hypothetical protein
MIRRRILGLAVATAAAAAAAAVLVFALAFALYALVEPYLGRAGAAAVLAAVTAASMALTAVLAASAAKLKPRRELSSNTVGYWVERAAALVREQPVAAVLAALGAGFMAVRNPTYLGSVIRAFADGQPSPKRSRKK